MGGETVVALASTEGPGASTIRGTGWGRAALITAVVLASMTIALYAPVATFNFVNYDDPEYVTGNPHVREGLSVDGVVWAFTQAHAANWHPITWLSHMLDCEVFGLTPGRHHLVNVALHVTNVLLLFFFLHRITADVWPSAFVAALFATHPLHVESVAWIAERKDVLSTFFFLLTLLAYSSYVRRPTIGRYVLVALSFAMGLMAKPMVVTLPFVLLLLDVWPLRRSFWFLVPSLWFSDREPKTGNQEPETTNQKPVFLLAEKLPLFTLAAVTSVITYLVQQQSGAVLAFDKLSLSFRAANAVVAYAWYVGKTVWPSGLAAFYPIPTELTLATIVAALVLLVSITALVIRGAARFPYGLLGWFWFLGTLLPVIGLIKAGEQSTADRFTYIPHIGLFIVVAWAARDAAAQGRAYGAAVAAVGIASVAACIVLTGRQLPHWRDGSSLFRRALAVTDNNYVAHLNLGQVLAAQNRPAEALEHFSEAVRLRPDWARARVNLAAALSAVGDGDAALHEYEEALRLDPNDAMAHFNLGLLRAERGAYDDAIAEYGQALQLDPSYVKAHLSMGIALSAQGRRDAAIPHYTEALRLDPASATAHTNLAIVLEEVGRRAEAIPHYAEATRLVPNDPRVHFNLGSALEQAGQNAEALQRYRDALRAQSDFAPARLAVGNLLVKTGDRAGGLTEIRAALDARPGWPEAEAALAALVEPHRKIEQGAH